jgi:inhibitor of KinA sporulation pathway (predicted exonuclease)
MEGRRYAKAQPVDYYLVIDFEATCEKDSRGGGFIKEFPNEIIEFPVVVLNAKTLEIEQVR